MSLKPGPSIRARVSGKKAYFLRLYKINETLSDFILFDGEKDLNDNPLDRIIALVPIDKLIGIVCPVKMYQGKKEIAVRDIGLSSFETPTLEWFRDIAARARSSPLLLAFSDLSR